MSRITANLRDLGEDENAVAVCVLCADLADAVRDADYVVEAVSENLALKQKLFAEIERHVRPDTILASNTSVIPITAIMQGLDERGRALGTHWWNPPFLVPLVEVIETQWTSARASPGRWSCIEAAGKKPAHVKKDVPGFIGNRLQHALWREAISFVEQGICDAEDGRRRGQGLVRPPPAGSRPAGKCRSGRHRSHARHPRNRAAGHRQPARSRRPI